MAFIKCRAYEGSLAKVIWGKFSEPILTVDFANPAANSRRLAQTLDHQILLSRVRAYALNPKWGFPKLIRGTCLGGRLVRNIVSIP